MTTNIDGIRDTDALLAEVARYERAFDAAITRLAAEAERCQRMRDNARHTWLLDIIRDMHSASRLG